MREQRKGGRFAMITLEACLCVIVSWCALFAGAVLLERLCSCYFPFLLTARFYVRIKNPKLREVLISPLRNRSGDSQTAAEDRDKLPLPGCIYCVIVFPWLFCEIAILLPALVLILLESEALYTPLMTDLLSLCQRLFVSEYLWFVIAGLFLFYQIDYSLGLRRWQKKHGL